MSKNRKILNFCIIVFAIVVLSTLVATFGVYDSSIAFAADNNISYEIRLHHNNQIYYLASNGIFSDTKTNLVVGSKLTIDEVNDNFKTSIGLEPGKVFKNFYWIDENNNEQPFGWIGSTVPNDFPSSLDIYPKYNLESYALNFYKEQSIISSKIYHYEEKIEYPEVEAREGYTFVGWIIKDISVENSPYKIGTQFSYNTVPDLSANSEGDVTISFEEHWSPIVSKLRIIGQLNQIYYYTVRYGQQMDFLSKFSYPKNGYTLVCWQDNEGTFYTNNSKWTKGQVNKIVEYTIRPCFEPTPYYISYKLNGGKIFNAPNSYTIQSNIDLTDTKQMPVPEKFGYVFNGWKCGNTTITNISNRTGNITLTAQWLGVQKQSTAYTNNSRVTDSIIILDFSNEPSSFVNKVINIASSVNQITLKSSGKYIMQDLRFVIESRTTPITILLWDMQFKAHPDYNAIHHSNVGKFEMKFDKKQLIVTGFTGTGTLNIGYQGKNIVCGGDRYTYGTYQETDKFCTAMMACTININGANKSGSLTLYGGDGKHGENGASYTGTFATHGVSGSGRNGLNGLNGGDGEDGQEGGYGICANYLNITNANMYIYGGNGGNGGNGGDGQNGGNGAAGRPKGDWGEGGNGGNGGSGGNGGDGGGGRGGTFVNKQLTITESYVFIYIGTNGSGGNGGNGGKGGYGGKGRDGVFAYYAKHGGNGGNGGNAGNGGTAGLILNSDSEKNGFTSVTSRGDERLDGYKGKAGAGGNAGANGTKMNGKPADGTGVNGTPGQNATKGR